VQLPLAPTKKKRKKGQACRKPALRKMIKKGAVLYGTFVCDAAVLLASTALALWIETASFPICATCLLTLTRIATPRYSADLIGKKACPAFPIRQNLLSKYENDRAARRRHPRLRHRRRLETLQKAKSKPPTRLAKTISNRSGRLAIGAIDSGLACVR